MEPLTLYAAGLAAMAASGVSLPALRARLQLSAAKHRSLQGHPRLSQRIAALVPFYEYDEDRFFCADDAPAELASRRRVAFERLSCRLHMRAPETIERSEDVAGSIADLQFVNAYRVPFQFSRYVSQRLPVGALVRDSCGVFVRDLDGNASYDLTGSYGVNVFGYDFYKSCIDAGIERVRSLGPVLGSYHPVVEENVQRLKDISGLDEVSFHMSGTEAVMQAVRLARYHTGRSHVVRFSGAYHGWWDGVQAGVGNPRPPRDVYTLKDLDARTLHVLRTRRDIACVLVNPLQCLHPNASPPSDAALVGGGDNGDRRTVPDRAEYGHWLKALREVCTERSIPLIFDEVFVGFRIACAGAQEYFGVRADLVTYGKTVAGGLPIGVLCGTRGLMRRFRQDRPLDVCFARGTFNSHPYVMGAMNEFLRRLDEPAIQRGYATLEATWNRRARLMNECLAARQLPVRVANLVSIWTIEYTAPSRYHWMFQYYLRAEGLALSWIGTGRLIFSHNYSDADFRAVVDRFVAAAAAMRDDGWWDGPPSLSSATIRKQVLREMIRVRARFLNRQSDRRARPAAGRAARDDRSSRRETGRSGSS